jgi:hypothetical protein
LGELIAAAGSPPDEDVSIDDDHLRASYFTSSIGDTISPRIFTEP